MPPILVLNVLYLYLLSAALLLGGHFAAIVIFVVVVVKRIVSFVKGSVAVHCYSVSCCVLLARWCSTNLDRGMNANGSLSFFGKRRELGLQLESRGDCENHRSNPPHMQKEITQFLAHKNSGF